MQPIADRELTKVFWILLLDAQHRVMAVPVETDDGRHELVAGPVAVTRGILNSSLMHPREVFAHAILNRACALIAVHNHPSGDPTPSADDRVVTEQLIESGRVLDIPVHDHVVLGTGAKYVSFAERGWM